MRNKNIYFILFLIVISFCLVGCGGYSWKNKVELSDLIINDDYIEGKIKNKTDNYYEITIYYEIKNGGFSESDRCKMKLKPNTIDDVHCLQSNYDNSYTIEVTDVDLFELTIPSFDNNNLSSDSLEYYYEDIYNHHTLSIISMAYDMNGENYPYIDKISYDEEKNIIEISYNAKYKDSKITIYDYYDIKTQELSFCSIYISNFNDEILSDIRTRVTGVAVVNDISVDSVSLLQALKRTDIESGKCVKVGKWCVSANYNDVLTNFYLEKR